MNLCALPGCSASAGITITSKEQQAASIGDQRFDLLAEDVLAIMKQEVAQSKVEILTPEAIAANVQQQYQNMDAETKGYYAAIAEVMQQCLGLSNPACIESGLHGLGHLATFLPDIAVPIVDGYLKNRKKQPKALVEYAKMARTGMIL